MRHTGSLVLLPLALTLACNREPISPTADHPLVGRFEWVSSSGGLASHEITPVAIGYTVRFEFERTRVRTYRNDEKVDDTGFAVSEDRQRESPLPVYIVKYDRPLEVFTFSEVEGHTVQWAGKAILVLDEGCCDRYIHTITDPSVR